MSTGVDLCGLRLGGPVLNGSGTFDFIAARRTFGDSLLDAFPFDAFVTKTITLAPREGNPPPRLWETPGGLLNSIGLPNKGLRRFLDEDLPELADAPVPLVVSVMGFSREELATLVEAVTARAQVAMIELNFSCPNVESGLVMGADPGETRAALERLRRLTRKPLIVKLTPNASDPPAVAAAAEGAGADAVSLVNTLRGAAIDPRTGLPALGAGSGGLSGAAIRVVGIEQVRSVAARVSIPVIGMGGIATGADAAEYMAAGAACVAVGTESFRDPAAGHRVRAELAAISGGRPGGPTAAERLSAASGSPSEAASPA